MWLRCRLAQLDDVSDAAHHALTSDEWAAHPPSVILQIHGPKEAAFTDRLATLRAGGDEPGLRGALPWSQPFLEYAASPRAAELSARLRGEYARLADA
jgi:hypothetical protein